MNFLYLTFAKLEIQQMYISQNHKEQILFDITN